MSYDITFWKVKEIENLKIPLEAIQELPYVEVRLLSNNNVEADGPTESFDLKGTLEGSVVNVIELEYGGEGSGHAWEKFKDMFRLSTGKFIASIVWEGGDAISRLIIKNGKVTEEEINI